MRILLVEDDPWLGQSLQATVKADGYLIDWLQDGIQANEAIKTDHFDLIILDIGLPRKNGLDILRELRDRGDMIPVLLLTAHEKADDRVIGLDTGADDYLVKPFSNEEITARIRALIRRSTGRATPKIQHGDICLDPAAHTVHIKQDLVPLSRREYTLLHALLAQSGKVISRQHMTELLYGWNDEVDSNTLEVHIHHLRKKLGCDLISTVRGIGYMAPKPKKKK